MYYDFAISIAANTAEASATRTHLKLAKGIIHRVEVHFPPGCAALAHCRLLWEGSHLYPSNPSGSFASDGYAIGIDDHIEFFRAPYILIAECWNTDDTYAHTITVRVGIIESKWALLFLNVLTGLSKLLKLMGIK